MGGRELNEECGLKANVLNDRGKLIVEKEGQTRAEVHLFTTNAYHGQIFESNGKFEICSVVVKPLL